MRSKVQALNPNVYKGVCSHREAPREKMGGGREIRELAFPAAGQPSEITTPI